MIWPIILLLGIGRFVWLPVPVILLWPIMVVLLILSAPLHVFSGESKFGMFARAVWHVSRLFAAMNGTRIHVHPMDGPGIRVIVT